MANPISTGQITIVDLTDSRPASFYLQANRSKIQTYIKKANGTEIYDPNYEAVPLEIYPSFFFGNEDYSSKITESIIKYYINDADEPVTIKGLDYSPGDGDKVIYQKGKTLYIKQNLTETNKIYKIKAVITNLKDEKTQLVLDTISALIEVVLASGVSVYNIRPLYHKGSKDIAPSLPESPDVLNGWSDTMTNFTPDENSYLWTCSEISYTNGTYQYTAPFCDESWKIASDGLGTLNSEIQTIKDLTDSMQGQIDSAINTYYDEGNPNDSEDPWVSEEGNSDDIKEKHIGDLYYDKISGKSYRYLKEEGEYKWILIQDSDVTTALGQIETLQTTVDGLITIYNSDTPPTSEMSVDDIWISPITGNSYKYNEDGKWHLISQSIDSIETEYASHSKNNETPTSGWSTTSPTWEEGKYIWQRTKTVYKRDSGNIGNLYIDTTKFNEIMYSDAVCISAAGAKGITVTASGQVFTGTYDTNNAITYTPNSITLTAATIGGLEIGGWAYYNSSNSWTRISNTASSISISPTDAAFLNGKSARIRVYAGSDAVSPQYYDEITIYKIDNGKVGENGEDASTVFLTNENISFAADKDGVVTKGTSFTCNVVAYTGINKVTPVVGTITASHNTINVSTGAVSNNEIPLTISTSSDTNLGSSDQNSGTITIPITFPVNTSLTITWSKVNTGKTGDNAIFASIESVDGRSFFDDLNSGEIELKAYLYNGGIRGNGSTYSWSFVPPTSVASALNQQTLTLTRDEVPSNLTVICTVNEDYKDSIVISDKTDIYYCEVVSSKGDKFTNNNIDTILTCRLFSTIQGEITENSSPLKLSDFTCTWLRYGKANATTEVETTETIGSGFSLTLDNSKVFEKGVFTASVARNE